MLQTASCPQTLPGHRRLLRLAGIIVVGALLILGAWRYSNWLLPTANPAIQVYHGSKLVPYSEETAAITTQQDNDRVRAPDFDGGIEWLNCSGPIRIKDLRGKVVLLDFWAFCCINCMHILPDLAKLEEKYSNELVVIGVHSAKFDAEKVSKNIRDAVLRYHIEHPVVNDANHKIWESYFVTSWPTFTLIDPEGYIYGQGSGEGLRDVLDTAISKLIQTHRTKKTLKEKPLTFLGEKFRQRKTAPLFCPGKVLADEPN